MASKDTILPKADSLQAAVVTAVMRPHMKGDTLEYNTEHIKMPPNSVVEELLKRLPGLQVDADGTITYNGERIEHLLVDGEDIFGSNPTMVTRNFDASKISRIQILDRKSDQTIFTGIDDGIRTKTLNLVMKESAKNGYFGKVELGGNTNGYYNVNGALAAFRDKEQFTALGLTSNTGITSFTNSAGGTTTAVAFLSGNSDPLGASAGTGIPHFDALALHYANTWNGPADHSTANYQYSHYFTQPITNSTSYQTQSGSNYAEQQNSQSSNRQDQHWIYGIYDWAPNTRSAFRFTFHGSNSSGQNKYYATSNGAFGDTSVNRSERTIRDNVGRENIGGDISWRIRIGNRDHQVFSITAVATKINNTTNGNLYSLNQFYQPDESIQSVDTIDERKQIVSQFTSFGASASYIEPIWNGATLALAYELSHTANDDLQATFDRGDGKYQQMVDSLSSHFKSETINQRATINLQGKKGHLSYTIGNDWIGYNYRQQNLIADSIFHLHNINLAPRFLLNYTPNLISNLSFRYNASTQQPTSLQLTPATNNSDPLHITLGNPSLKPGFKQTFQLGFHRFKTWLINLSLLTTLANNSISTKTITDSLGRQISQPVNVDGGYSNSFNLSINRNLLGLDIGWHTDITHARTVNYVNSNLNLNNTYIVEGGFSLNKFIPEKYNLQLKTSFSYLDEINSINTTSAVRYWAQNHQASFTVYLIRGVEINATAIYTWQEKTSAFSANTSTLLWNDAVSKNFLHNKIVARIQIYNILNENAGISRTNTNNITTQSTTNILGRYWMFSAIYHFDKHFAKNRSTSVSKSNLN